VSILSAESSTASGALTPSAPSRIETRANIISKNADVIRNMDDSSDSEIRLNI
jgi:hypothetical protein